MLNTALRQINASWMRVLAGDENGSMELLEKIAPKLSNTCPPPELWFEFARLSKYEELKVVIIGQDPYFTEGTAHGLAFSCMGKIPPSLKNIYKCLVKTGCLDYMPESADLTRWAKQGVLLINGALTTRLGEAKAHAKQWAPYVRLLIETISQDFENDDRQLIFMLWGGFAQGYEDVISDYHHIMKWAHPSPLAQGRLSPSKKFVRCDHFKKANELLAEPIDWRVDDSDSEESSDESSDEPSDEEPKRVYQDWYNPEFFQSDGNKHVVFTDGSCEPNNKSPSSVGGYAAVFVDGKFQDTALLGNLGIGKYFASNIRAEGMAISDSFDLMLSDKKFKSGVVVTDCQLWINMLTMWMRNWDESKFREKENYDITSALWDKWNRLKRKGTIEIVHTPSHNKKKWLNEKLGTYKRYCGEQNKYADALANYARLNIPQQTTQKIEVPYEGYLDE